ncbi:hypothetical protein VNI00_003261 [Paramarasmius palmivorus]|uniref:Uncharacterized protein n=1 Tax=Paramarasmius palmivorus TaxID=297713 RepID=A0AAW0DSA4_9AGAR
MVPAPVKAKTCPGLCKRSSIRRANVVCISAARDGEEAYEANGISIAQKIADYLKDHRKPTYKKLMRAISFHTESQDIERRLCKGRTFVWKEQHPELSSQVPLNMNNRLLL